MKRTDIKKILIIGAGPIVIGQGCEFDYSGVQAVKALKREGFEVVLVNSNPATVMTDPERADHTYIEPLTVDVLHEVIRRERPDAILPTLGGQTALNLAMELEKSGVLRRYRVELIGADAEAISRAEDRQRFKEAMRELGLDMPRSGSAHSMEEAEAVARTIGTWPLIVRPGFTLGGTGGGIAHNAAEFRRIVTGGLEASLNREVLIEESLIGWKEYEMEVMRDRAGNAVIVCSIENIDPMGVHTGDSITVAPILTLTDREYQAMRDDSIRVLEKIGIETGGSNVQWAVDPKTGRRIIIEMNPRVSRSSALASKATGFPIAKIAALLAVGYTLDEIANDITRCTPSCFEPALDYVVVKIPRFAFEKFPGADTRLGTQMKAVGEVMAIGRTFKQAYLKAARSLEAPLRYHDESAYDPWFKRELEEIAAFRAFLAETGAAALEADLLRQAKTMGFSDREIAEAIGCDEATVRSKRLAFGIRPEFGAVDTCAGEFKAITPYYYSYYAMDSDSDQEASTAINPKRKIMVLGGGPNRIGQGIEFDWCCCHAAFALRERGYEVVMVNSNPETVSTDYDTSDRLYFEPLTFEDVMAVYEREACDGVIVQYGGQTPLNLAARLKAAGARVIGTAPEDIDRAEDRDFFRALVNEVGMRQPASGIAHSVEDARQIALTIGYPVLVRPSFVLGGRGMAIVYAESELDAYVAEAVAAAEGKPILIDKFLENAIELDVDCISDGETTVVGAVLEHVEAAGCHSGDAAAVTPPRNLTPKTLAEVKRYAEIFAQRLHVIGLMNLQLAVKDDEIWMIEVNPRASRTVPFVSKAIGVPLAGYAARCMVGEKLSEIGFTQEIMPRYTCVKEAVFPFVKFPGARITLSPEMKSTGEVMAIDFDPEAAYFKSQVAAGSPLPKRGNLFLSVRDEDKARAAELAAELERLGYGIYATCGTSTLLWERGIPSKAIFRISRGRPNAVDLIRAGEIGWVVNTSESGGEASGDSIRLRSTAVAAGVPVTTTLAGFEAAVSGLVENGASGGELAVYTLQEYHGRTRK
ncbi:MAG: carbamoyl-phosphate synthase large subunit [Kiritimatiellae bacterium]|nr:carbamoyl-phosphate synthase large subunit [Kiritimatiellia bacterium]